MKKILLKEISVIALFALILFLFYRSIWAFILLPFAGVFFHRRFQKELKSQRSLALSAQFKDALESITAALRTGYSFENSITEAALEMRSIYGEKSIIYQELSRVTKELNIGINTQTALSNMAKRNPDNPDIETFASIFQIALKSGGDLVDIIKKTADDISARIETRGEIAVMISSKKLEHTIMSFMPMGIIIYIGLASPDILAPLYGNLAGVIIMTVCLIIYAGAYLISLKIMQIDF